MLKFINLQSVVRFIKSHQQLFLGLALGALIMLPAGLYASYKVLDNQEAKSQVEVTQQDVDDKDSDKLTPNSNSAKTNASQSQGSSNTNKPKNTSTPSTTYVPHSCIKNYIPYSTTIQIGQFIGTTSTEITGGIEGYKETCTASSTGFMPAPLSKDPINKTITVGTGGITATTPPRTYPPEPDQLDRIKADCGVQLAKHGNQEAYNLCVSTLARYFNIPL